MAITVESFAGHDIQSSTYVAYLDTGDSPYSHAVDPTLHRPLVGPPSIARTSMTPRTLPVHIEIVSGDLQSGWETLNQWFRPGTSGELLVTFGAVSRALDATVLRVIPYEDSPNLFTAVLLAADPRWRSADVQRTAQTVTATPTTFAVTNAGNTPEDGPRWLLQPTTFKAVSVSSRYRRDVVVANLVSRAFVNYPLEILGGYNHAADVSASKALASGDDFRVLVDGVEVYRYNVTHASNTWNTAALRVFIALDLAPRKTATLRTAMTTTSPLNGEDIEVYDGDLDAWPEEDVIKWDDEVIHYRGKTARNANGRAAFQNVIRGYRNTTIATHAADITGYWVQHRIQVMYGNSGASTPAKPTQFQPLLDLTSSALTNSNWVQTDFADSRYPLRPGTWRRTLASRDDQSNLIRAATGTPVGALAFTYNKLGPTEGNPNHNQWERDFPTGTDGNISITRAVDDTMAVRLLCLDAEGNEIKSTVYAGALASSTVTVDPGDMYALRFWGFNQIIGASPLPVGDAGGATMIVSPPGSAFGQQIITGTEPVILNGISLYTSGDGVGARTLTVGIFADDGADVPAGASTPSPLGTATVAQPSSGTAAWNTGTFGTPLTLQPSTKYWIIPYTDGGTPTWRYQIGGYHTGGKFRLASANGVDKVFGFKLLGYTGDLATSLARMDDNCIADDADSASVTALTVPLLSTGVPYVSLKGEQEAYYLDAKMRNLATGQQVQFKTLLGLLDKVEVDAGRARAARNLAECPYALTLSGNEVTDLVRRAASSTQGPASGDGRAVPDGSMHIGAAFTNLITNGDFETNTTGWSKGGTNTIDVSTEQFKFGSKSMKCTYQDDTSLAWYDITLTAAAHSQAVWVYVPTAYNGTQLQVNIALFAGVTGPTIANVNMALRDQWQRVVLEGFTPDAGDLAGRSVIIFESGTAPTAGRFIYVDGAQVATGTIARPFHPSSRSAARVRIPVHDLFTEEQGWAFFRGRAGWTSTQDPSGNPTLFQWKDDANNLFELRYDTTANQWEFQRRNTSGTSEDTAADTFTRDDLVDLLIAWTATTVYVEVDTDTLGAGTANTTIPTLTAQQADIGSSAGSAEHIDSDVLWMVTGKGTVTSADLAALRAYGSTDPDPRQLARDLAPEAQPTGLWWGDNGRFFRLEEPESARGESIAHTIEAIAASEWLRLEPGSNRLVYEETGAAGVGVTVLSDDRWT